MERICLRMRLATVNPARKLLFVLSVLVFLWRCDGASPKKVLELAFKNVSGFNVSDVCGRTDCASLRSLEFRARKLQGIVDWRLLSTILRIEVIDLAGNGLSGHVTDDLWRMPRLKRLDLSENQFGGSLNFNWTKFNSKFSSSPLQFLNLSFNRLHTFDGTLNLSGFQRLETVDLSQNRITGGKIIAELLKLQSLRRVSLAGNNLQSLKVSTSEAAQLQYLNLSHCNLSGGVSSLLAKSRDLRYLDLSHNNLSGSFLPSKTLLSNLKFLNISFNSFIGNLNKQMLRQFGPTAFTHSGLRVHSPHPHHHPHKAKTNPAASGSRARKSKHSTYKPSKWKIAAVASAGALTSLFLIVLITALYIRRRKPAKPKEKPGPEVEPADPESSSCNWVAGIERPETSKVVMFEKPLMNLTLKDLLQLTSDFSKDSQMDAETESEIAVYRAILPGDLHVTIKVIETSRQQYTSSSSSSENDTWKRKLETLGRIKHTNILSLLGYCIAGSHVRLLIYEFVQNGDLHQWLHELPGLHTHMHEVLSEVPEGERIRGGHERLGWPVRHRIALGVARALAFLHHNCSCAHGCLSARNVLLDENFEPHVADAGLRQLIASGEEGGSGGDDVAMAADVYSFGTLLVELLTRKTASDDVVAWVRHMVKSNDTWKVIDSQLLMACEEEEEEEGRRMKRSLEEGVRICYLCTAESASKRPSMHQIVGLLKDIRPSS